MIHVMVIKEQSKLDSLLNQLETPLSNAQNAISSSSLIPSEMKNQIDELYNSFYIWFIYSSISKK
ncbi:hypothetical protein BLOT_011743 [Blomia tropicalis]|nr:hypothetical protein BLOT_011743 [Blomia tropicalis]